jgi:hypothetical protein
MRYLVAVGDAICSDGDPSELPTDATAEVSRRDRMDGCRLCWRAIFPQGGGR